jgi:endonuclease-3
MATSRKTSERRPAKAAHVDRSQRPRAILRELRKAYPDATCALTHSNAFELLTATILSAQCTDERVNMATPELFRRYPTPQALAQAKQEVVEKIIKPLGFFRAKAANLLGMAKRLVDEYGGEVPQDLESLITLPGVGRKTANVVLGTVFGIPSGVVVDTHVKRITYLLGLTKQTDPVKVEADLMQIVPKDEWIDFSHRLIHHGRRICIARRPKCKECPLLKLCDRVGLPPLDQ